MHGYAYSHRNGVTVIPPYAEGSHEYKRNGRKPAIANVYDAVAKMLDEQAEYYDGHVWWKKFDYTISVTANHEPGKYVYRVNKVPPKVSLVKSDDPWVNTQTVGTPPF